MTARQIYTFPTLVCAACGTRGCNINRHGWPFCSAKCADAGPSPAPTPETVTGDYEEMARGRPKGSKNKVDGEPTPGKGDNSKTKPVATANVIAQALAEVTSISVEIASLSGRKVAAIKRWEDQGVDRELLAALAKLSAKDPAGASAYIAGLTKYAAAADIIVVASHEWTTSVQQAELFAADGDAADELKRARAHKQGFQAGKKGHDIQSSPYQSQPGSIEFVGWRDGHGEGKALRTVLKPGSENIKEASTSKVRRDPPKPANDVDPETLAAEITKELAEKDAVSAAIN